MAIGSGQTILGMGRAQVSVSTVSLLLSMVCTRCFQKVLRHYHCSNLQKTMALLTMVLCPNTMVMAVR